MTVACNGTPPPAKMDASLCAGLLPDENGFLNCTVEGVLGSWYSYGDSYNVGGGNGDCQSAGFTAAQCSTATSPAFGAPFANIGGRMCLSGTAAAVMAPSGSATPDYSAIWGVGIGFDFNNAGTGDAGTSAGKGKKLPWNATAYGVTGFRFDIVGVPVGGNLRVEFPFMGQMTSDAPYWEGAGNNLSPITSDGTYSFRWTDVTGPMDVPNPPMFDPTMIISTQFHVVSNTTGPIGISNMCVSNVTLMID